MKQKLKAILCSTLVVLMILSSLIALIPTASVAHAAGNDEFSEEHALPSRYCMRDEYIVLAQNQDKHGFCWDFAATMSAATTIMKATGEYYDFSELWTGIALNNCTTKHNKIGAGGSFSYQYDAMKESGLMLECDLPYQYSFVTSSENSADYYNFFERYSNDDLASCLVSDKDTSFAQTEIEEIKEHIYTHGSIYLTFSFKQGYVDSEGASYLPPNQKNYNSSHAVSVIGWDDNFEREVYLEGSDTPKVFKGAWLILNSYTEKSGVDGLSYVFYEDTNIGSIQGYRYEPDTDKDFYFYDKIESGYAYPNYLIGRYYGDFSAESGITKQKNIFYDDVYLEYSYIASSNTTVKSVDIFLNNVNVTDDFKVSIYNGSKKFFISKDNADYGQYKVLVTYTNGDKSDVYLNNFFVTHGLVGEEIEYDTDNNSLGFNTGRDLEYYSFILPEKSFIIYTNSLSGTVSFVPTEQSVYSQVLMSMPQISYSITDGNSCVSTYSISSHTGYSLEYNFIFEYYEDTSLQPVNVYYDLGGGVNNPKNYAKELASPDTALTLYEPTRAGYTFAGWYLDYGNASKKVEGSNGVYYVSWDDIHHMGETPGVNASSYYNQHYKNSNTLFVYAHWVEEDYYNVDLSIVGEATTQINNKILVRGGESVRFVLNPKSGWCLTELTVNGTPVGKDKLIEAIKYGLLLENVDRDISVVATFSEGVYLSLKFGENVKTAYIIGEYNGVTKKFYDGDFIPAEYFSSEAIINNRLDFDSDRVNNNFDKVIDKNDHLDLIVDPDRFDNILDGPIRNDDIIINPDFIINPDLIIDPDEDEDKEENAGADIKVDELPPIVFPGFGTHFTLVVELYEDRPGYTYVLDGVESYVAQDKSVFRKTVAIKSSAQIAEFDVGSATERATEQLEVKYGVGNYVVDHYMSADPEAKSGVQNSAVYEAGQVVYLFIKTKSSDFMYKYTPQDSFVYVGDGWYRMAIYVITECADVGRVVVYRERQTYTVTWKNWDGTVLYTETYRYGDTPVYNNRYGESKYMPSRPDDDEFSYIFTGWDKRLVAVTSDITFIAQYETVLRRYAVNVSPAENGTVSTDGENYLNREQQKTYFFTPDPGYTIKDVIINGVSVGPVLSYTFKEVTTDQTLEVIFEKISHSFTVICGPNGSTDISGTTQVTDGSSVTLNITPAELYAIASIKINGVDVDISSTVTVENITKDTYVEIGFRQSTVTVTTQTVGKESELSQYVAAAGENVRIDFKADLGYRIKDVKIDGVSVGATDHYTFIGIDRNHTVTVEQELDKVLIIFASSTALVLIVIVALISVIIKRSNRYLRTVIYPRLPSWHSKSTANKIKLPNNYE